MVRTKRLCRVGVGGQDDDLIIEDDMMTDGGEQNILEDQAASAVEELKLAMSYQYVSSTNIILCYINK